MSRNLVEMSKDIFDKIKRSAANNDDEFLTDENIRWLKLSNEDKHLVHKAELEWITIGLTSVCASIKVDGSLFFCFSGFPAPRTIPDGLEEINLNPGLFSCVLFEAEIPSIATAFQARDVLQDFHKDIEGYNGHELEDVLDLFPPMRFYRANTSTVFAYHSSLERVCGSYTARLGGGPSLSFTLKTREKLILLFEGGSDSIPYHLPLQGIQTLSWAGLYLDLYRCIEQLYSAQQLTKISGDMNASLSLFELAQILEEKIGWRPRERDSIKRLCDQLSEETRCNVVAAFAESSLDTLNTSGGKCGDFIYDLRNSLVHYRPGLKRHDKHAADWNNIISVMCDVIGEVHGQFGADFFRKRA